MQIKDISKQALRINRFHLVREDQIKGEIAQKQQGIAAAQREQRERLAGFEKEVLSLRQELDLKELKIQQLLLNDKGTVMQRERVAQLEEEVLRLKQELDMKGQVIQQLQLSETGVKTKLAIEAKAHFEAI